MVTGIDRNPVLKPVELMLQRVSMRTRLMPMLLVGVLGVALRAAPVAAAEVPGSDRILHDFTVAGDRTEWSTLNDVIMGGSSTSRFEKVEGAMRFSGSLSQKNRGGFASIRDEMQLRDLAHADGFEFKVRGDGREYSLMIWTDDVPDRVYYGASFTPPEGEWQVINLTWADFKPYFRGFWVAQGAINPNRIVSIGVMISDGASGPFVLDLAWVRWLEKKDGGSRPPS